MKQIHTRKKYWNCPHLNDTIVKISINCRALGMTLFISMIQKRIIMEKIGIGKIALLLAINDDEKLKKQYEDHYTIYKGQAGSMDAKKIIASIETAAYRENIIRENYHEEHALYHAVIEALSGYCRGQVMLGEVLRSAGLTFTIVKGTLIDGDASSGNWIAVVLYGQIGSPRRGFEHEAIGMGIQPI